MVTHLVVPGLLGYLPRLREYEDEVGALPRFPNLELVLSRARQAPAPEGFSETLFELFGAAVPENADVPTAAVCYCAEAGAEPTGDACLMHADPVHLRPDQDRLLAFDFHHHPLSDEEAKQFAEAFNLHFRDDGLRLIIPHATRWYLVVDKQPYLRTRSLAESLGRNIDFFLPEGRDAALWRGWMNELQMLFHGLPVNKTRESLGQLPVSGLWFSGGGRKPAGDLQGYSVIEGDCVLAKGLQTLCGEKLNQRLVLRNATRRAVLDADPSQWVEAIRALDTQLGEYLKREFVLFPCEGRAWHWRPMMRRRVWKRIRPFKRWLPSSS